MTLKLRNTLSGQLEEFQPAGDVVTIYVCGVTPYDASHVGHAMSYIIFDTLRRYLEYRGYRVRHVQNFTDIDDRIIARAERLGCETTELAAEMSERFLQEMDALNVIRAHIYPRATEEIPHMIEMIEGLVEKGYAYPADGDVYYRVDRKEGYGKLSHRDADAMMAGARVEPGEQKEHPADFALWKGAKPGEPYWESPWGPGRPGWHIECSAMSLRYLGEQIDIHGGGEDLIFPHHENEIAQTEAFTGKTPFARFWLHNGHLEMGAEKMSKSLGNVITIRNALDAYGGDAFRIFVQGSHYRSPLTYSEAALEAARSAGGRLRTALEAQSDGSADPVDPAPFRERFVAAMEDDLGTGAALAALFDLARELNRARDAGRGITDAQATLRELADVLGLRLAAADGPATAAPFIDLLIELRKELRAAKQYELADSVRSRLGELGIILEDSPQGTTWKSR